MKTKTRASKTKVSKKVQRKPAATGKKTSRKAKKGSVFKFAVDAVKATQKHAEAFGHSLPRLEFRHWPKWQTVSIWLAPVAVVAAAIFFFKASSGVKYPVNFTSAKLITMAEKAQKYQLSDRVAFWSENLLHNPRLLSSLSPGPKLPDIAPVFPTEYDCTTFVETVAALARSRSIDELADQVVAIRYGSDDVSFDTRNHFPEADWIPHNASKGILKDITAEVAKKVGVAPAFARKEINRGAWLAKQKERPATREIAGEQVKKVELPYIPMDKMAEAIKHIPQGAVLNIVRSNSAVVPVLITHQGFLVWKDGVAYFRHASRNRQIADVPFFTYVEHLKSLPWKAVGVNVNTFVGFNVNAFQG